MADTTTWVLPQRWIPLSGPLNFRDIGGYLTRSGATVAWGHLFRSDSLDGLDEDDVGELRRLGLRTVIDLRCPQEHATARVDCGALRRDLALLELGSARQHVDGRLSLSGFYRHILIDRADVFREAVELIADAPTPLVFHCTAGKDRTGLVAAVLLGALGVTDADIARDYALSHRVLPQLLERVRARLAHTGLALPAALESADAETMRSLLREVNKEHGSMLGYALDAGVDPSVIDTLRDRLLA